MTAASDILNADMTTIGRWLRGGLRWWLTELAALVPPALRRSATAQRPQLRLDPAGRLAGTAPGPRSRPAVLLPASAALTRRVILPDLPTEALWRTLDAETSRLLPLAPDAVLVARRAVARDRAAGTAEVEIAGLPLSLGSAVAAEIARLGVVPARVGLLGADGEEWPGLDFLPAMRARGLVAPGSRQPLLFWAVAAFLFLLNIAVLVWRDEARVEAIQALVDGQRPAVAATQRLQRRIARFDALAAAASARRSREPLALMGRVAAALPEGAYLLRFDVEGDTLRLSGYKPAGANIVAALRADPGLGEVRALRSDSQAERPGAQAFDISARVLR
jgi:hypothetical protein